MVPLDNMPARQDWHGLPGEFFRSEEVYQAELERIWRAAWLFACPSCEVPQAGDFITLTVAGSPVLVIRAEDGIRAFYNLCPHRGTLLCDAARGHAGPLLVCPYHQWTFTRSGALHSCRGMHAVDPSGLGLRPLPTLTVAGLVFVCLAAAPPGPGPLQQVLAAARPHGFDGARVAHALDYRVAANWKVVWENNRECYHCDVGHPHYVRSNFDSAEGERDTPAARSARAAILARSAAYWAVEGLSVKHDAGGLARFPDPEGPSPFPASATRTVLAEGYDTESMDGRRVGPFMGALRSAEVGVLRLRSLPSFWCHASCDHAVLTRVLPESRGVTTIRVTWLVAGGAREDIDYSLDRLLPFWQLTSEQDWQLCERAARGVTSPAYRPGPLSQAREYNVEAFFRWYLARLR
jgi:Rieske 2Fe-2S family protein